MECFKFLEHDSYERSLILLQLPTNEVVIAQFDLLKLIVHHIQNQRFISVFRIDQVADERCQEKTILFHKLRGDLGSQ